MTDLQAFLEKVSTLTPPPTVVKLPSSGVDTNIFPLNIIQQKKLLTDGIASEYELIGFTKTLNEILIEIQPDARLIDRSYLAVVLRNISIDKEFNGINLSKIVNNTKWTKNVPQSININVEGLSISVEMPFLKDEIAFLNYLSDNLNKDEEYNTRLIYSLEILKYIKTLSIDGVVLNFADLDVKTRLTVFDKLPIACTKDIVSYIENFKKAENDMLTVGNTAITIDREFFSV